MLGFVAAAATKTPAITRKRTAPPPKEEYRPSNYSGAKSCGDPTKADAQHKVVCGYAISPTGDERDYASGETKYGSKSGVTQPYCPRRR